MVPHVDEKFLWLTGWIFVGALARFSGATLTNAPAGFALSIVMGVGLFAAVVLVAGIIVLYKQYRKQ